MSLIDRDTGRAYSEVITQFRMDVVHDVLSVAVSPKARLITDEAGAYKFPGRAFADHVSVNPRQGPVREPAGQDHSNQQRRMLLLDLQARHDRRLSALPRQAPSALPRRVRLPLFEPCRAGSRRHRGGSYGAEI